MTNRELSDKLWIIAQKEYDDPYTAMAYYILENFNPKPPKPQVAALLKAKDE
jgi:hypothetical protein